MKNISNETPEMRFENIVADLVRKVEEPKTNQVSVLVVPKLASDPASPIEGQIWENSGSHTLKIRLNGVTKTVTVS